MFLLSFQWVSTLARDSILPQVSIILIKYQTKLCVAGIAVCGSGAGTFIFAPLSSFLVQSYGWRGCNQVMAGLCLLCSVFGLVMVPVKRRSQAVEKTKLIDFEIFKNLPFVLYMVGQIPTVMAVYCTYSYIPSVTIGILAS